MLTGYYSYAHTVSTENICKGKTMREIIGDLIGGISLFAFGYLLLFLPLLF